MQIKMKALTTSGVKVLLVFDFRIHNLIIEQIHENVTYIKYEGGRHDSGCGEFHLLTDTMEEI